MKYLREDTQIYYREVQMRSLAQTLKVVAVLSGGGLTLFLQHRGPRFSKRVRGSKVTNCLFGTRACFRRNTAHDLDLTRSSLLEYMQFAITEDSGDDSEQRAHVVLIRRLHLDR